MNKVFVVMKNRDFTEGRGPMVPTDLCFDNEESAWEYCNTQTGIYGSEVPTGGWQTARGHWEVKSFTVLSSAKSTIESRKQEIREYALNKLSKEEREALGL